MTTLVFGELRFDRQSVPDELCDVTGWPRVDDSALPTEDRGIVGRRMQATTLFVDRQTSLREITRLTGARFNDPYRLFGRCVEMHDDGRIFGMRALIPYCHTIAYQRSAAITHLRDRQKGGASGAFSQLLHKHPDIARWVDRRVRERQ